MKLKAKKQWFLLGCALASVFSLGACGGDDDDESDGGSSVVNMFFDNGVIPVGGSAILTTRFTFSSDDVFDDDRDVVVVVRLPNGLTFRGGTAELSRIIDDRGISPQVITCSDGRSVLQFVMDEDDLTDVENPSGDADAEITLTVDALVAGSGLIATGEGRNDAVNTSCDTNGLPQSSATITVQ